LYRARRALSVGSAVTSQFVELWVTAGLDPGAGEEELEGRTLGLRQELLELDVEEVRPPLGGPAPGGARSGDAALLGTLVVTVGREAVGAVVRAVAGWLSRGGSRSIKLQLGDDSIELTDVSATDQRRMLEAFLARHDESAA
jgi:hypothetical protein